MEDRPYISYPFRSPRMDQSVPPNQVPVGSFGRLSGVDGRFHGCLRKYYGNKAVLDLDSVSGMGDIDTYNGPDYICQVTFNKRGTSSIYRGFVIRWDSQDDTDDEQIDLIYTSNNGSTWTKLAIWAAGNGITSDLGIDCTVDAGYLIVAVDTKATKTVYWSGSALTVVSSGPGDFDDTLAATTQSSTAVDTDYQLRGNGTYQVAWRFYDSTRGIYSALSDPLTIHMDHYKTTKAVGTVTFSSTGGDSGLLIDGDTITINGRVYEADDDSSYTGDVQVDISGLSTIADHVQALADAINGDSSAVVTASAQSSSVLLESKVRGTAGNAYTLAESETGANTNDIAVSGATLTGGGVVTTDAESQCKVVIDLPDNDEVISGKDYDDFSPLFDTVDIFRTIDLGDATTSQGAIFYLEQTIAKTGNWATSGAWDALQVTIGTIVDEALPFQTMYDPEKDVVVAPPQSGTIGRYEGQTYMAEAASVGGGYDTLWSSAEHASPEYFSTYNKHVGDPDNGRPLRFLPAGDSLFQLCYNAIVHIFKSGKLKPIQVSTLHRRRGITGKYAAHSSGNSIFMVSGLGLCVLNGADGSIGGISAADRVMFDDWKSDLADIKSGHDSLMSASFFLNPTAEEMLILWHKTQTCTLLDGANFVDITSGPDIGAGKNDRVFRWHELDEAWDTNLVKKADSAIFIQCVGSREPERPHCSKICCTFSVQKAVELKERNPQMDVYIIYRDIRTYGEREDLYKEARAKGVIFIRYNVENKPVVAETDEGSLEVTVVDHVLQRPITLTPDFITLASAIETRGLEKLAQMLKVPVSQDGFFMEVHQKLRPVDFATDGVFVCGLAHYPKPIDESITQAQAAAARAATVLAKKRIEVEGVVSTVDESLCRGCGECVDACPYGAPELVEIREGVQVSQIQEALCKGCGACAVACPTGAAAIRHFTDDEVLTMVEAALCE